MVTTLYFMTATDTVSGCVSVDSLLINVLATPTPNLGADTVICSHQTLLLDASAGSYTYMWQDSATTQTYNANLFGTYYVLVTDTTSGCIASDSILLGINSAPSFTLGSDVVVCAGTQVSFSGPSGPYSYLWSTADTVATITTGTAGSYDIAVTDIVNGCRSSDTVLLTVNPVPTVALGADTTVCSAAGAINLSGPAGPYTYLWSTSDTTQGILVSASGLYYITVSDSVTACASSDSVNVVYNLSPTVALSIVNDTVCAIDPAFTLTGSPAGGSLSGPGITGNIFDPATAGVGTHVITYTYTDSVGCSGTATDSIMVDICTKTTTIDALSEVTIYPNPNNGTFILQLNSSAAADVMIYDAQGKLVYTQKVQPHVATPMNIESSGMYMVTVITSDGQRASQRVMVTK